MTVSCLRRFFASRTAVCWLAAVGLAVSMPSAVEAQESAGVTFFTGPNFTGTSKTLTLAPDQPYAAVPLLGDALNRKIASLRADPQVGVILFQRPYFASHDDACGPNLGTHENPDAWWLGLTADFAPPTLSSQAYETGDIQGDNYGSVIAYRRDLGPPPGFLLLERRSYYNRSCEDYADQSYFNRIFVPIPNPPQREACTDLSTASRAPGAGKDAPRFTRLTDVVTLQPQAFSSSYLGIDHRFILTVFDQPGCRGQSISLTSSKDNQPASYRLSDFDFDRRAKSVMIRYQSGPLDRYLNESASAPQTALAPAPSTSATNQSGSVPKPLPKASAAGAAMSGSMGAPASPAPASEMTGSQAAKESLPANGGLQPAPPTAPPQALQQQALQPAPKPRAVPAEPAPATPTRPSGPQEETFRFPVHQVYRLNFCKSEDKECGEAAATTWCEDKGFSRAVRWTKDEHIGALYPTVHIGTGTICDKFLCDGFEEITCGR